MTKQAETEEWAVMTRAHVGTEDGRAVGWADYQGSSVKALLTKTAEDASGLGENVNVKIHVTTTWHPLPGTSSREYVYHARLEWSAEA